MAAHVPQNAEHHCRAVYFLVKTHDIDCDPIIEGVPMFARIVKSNLKPNHVAEFNQTIEKQVIPMLRKSKGFQDEITFAGPSGTEMISISFWDHKENAESYISAMYPEVLKALSTSLEGSPQVKTYEVSNSTFPKFGVHAAV
jgi:heme-degrading monooxygenase HmoA